ncbi:MAG: hypothetical protein HFI00_12715 [Lachnospiraceae bacterium]|jgi:D-alanine--poly(phosphoribitol) ligase subunit 2|nr:hypothetical protein [Lachnospiraceae bacterium]
MVIKMDKEVIAILKSIEPNSNFESSTDFFEDELIDSFGVMTLITLLERHFHISIRAEDISADNFMNLECIALLLKKYI